MEDSAVFCYVEESAVFYVLLGEVYFCYVGKTGVFYVQLGEVLYFCYVGETAVFSIMFGSLRKCCTCSFSYVVENALFKIVRLGELYFLLCWGLCSVFCFVGETALFSIVFGEML